MTDSTEGAGFEYAGEFYRWHVSDLGKDLMLIDRFTGGMAVPEFFDVVDDDHERTRGPILLTLIATSIRHGHPDWSVERIARTVMDLNLSQVEFIGGDEDGDAEAAPSPPAEGPPAAPLTVVPSKSPANGSSLSSTPAETSTSPTSSAALP